MPMPLIGREPATGRDGGRPRPQNGRDSRLDARTPARPPLPRTSRGMPMAAVRTLDNVEPETFEDRRNGAAGLGIP